MPPAATATHDAGHAATLAAVARSAEDRAWELLLSIAGAHADGGQAGQAELRRLAAEGREVLASAPLDGIKRRTGQTIQVGTSRSRSAPSRPGAANASQPKVRQEEARVQSNGE